MMSLHNIRSKHSKPSYRMPKTCNLPQLPFTDSPEPAQPEPDNLIQIPLNLRFHGFNYTQVCRGKRSAVYRQTIGQEIVGYEVFILQREPETTLYGKFFPAHERWPRDNDFDKTAWSCWTLEEAMLRFNALES